MKKIVLLGYMGVGKSTVGKELADRLQIPFYDLDDLIEKKVQMAVATIFEQKGEIYFRKLEHTILHEMMAQSDAFVLSLGGGTPCYANNHLVLQQADCFSFYLKASIALLVDRLRDEKNKRPLLAYLDHNEFTEYIAKHLFDRSYFYNQAKFKISIEGKTPQQISTEIEQYLT